MAHPYHHAVSTQRQHKGEIEDYIEVHAWFDKSKESLADARYRQVLHHSFGIFLAEERFGITITNSSGREIPVRIIDKQHVREDTGFIPSPPQAFGSMEEPPWMRRNLGRDRPHLHADATVIRGAVRDDVGCSRGRSRGPHLEATAYSLCRAARACADAPG